MNGLVCITDFGISQRHYLFTLLFELDKCYPDFKLDVIIYHTHELKLPLFRNLSIELKKQDESLQDMLTWCHRTDMINRRNQYGIYIYTENDLFITHDHLLSFILEQKRLPSPYVAGFIHYENEGGTKHLMPLNSGFPSFNELLQVNGNMYATLMNQHQGCYIITKEQLNKIIDSKEYNNEPRVHNYLGQHYHFKETAATLPYTIGGLKKVIPVDNVDEFLLWHMPNHYVKNAVSELFNKPFYTIEDFKKYYNAVNNSLHTH